MKGGRERDKLRGTRQGEGGRQAGVGGWAADRQQGSRDEGWRERETRSADADEEESKGNTADQGNSAHDDVIFNFKFCKSTPTFHANYDMPLPPSLSLSLSLSLFLSTCASTCAAAVAALVKLGACLRSSPAASHPLLSCSSSPPLLSPSLPLSLSLVPFLSPSSSSSSSFFHTHVSDGTHGCS